MKIEPFGEIKLIIWDLDETFWGGTLSEEGAVWRDENEALVRGFAERGVISSICSHNDEAPVFAALERHVIRDFFVFAKISWQPKGPQLVDLIQSAQLRFENVLFIDDQPRNLGEAQAACPGIKVISPDNMHLLFQKVTETKPSDPSLKRLRQYQIMEKKHKVQQKLLSEGLSRIEFLKESKIKIHHLPKVHDLVDRIHTMINRTNQLNFTKRRHTTLEETQSMLAQSNWRKGCFSVRDAYGDYGVVAFYAGPKDASLQHFLFSCRIMNMGVVEYVYDLLARPAIDTEEDIETLKSSSRPSWIQREHSVSVRTKEGPSGPRVLIRGGCLCDFLEAPLNQNLNASVDLDLSQWGSHSSAPLLTERSGDYNLEELGTFSKKMGNSDLFPSTMIFKKDYDLYVLEFSKDYRCELYEADEDVFLPIAPVGLNLKKPCHWETIARWRKEYRQIRASGPWFSQIYSSQGLAFLRDETRLVPIQERRDLFEKNVIWLVKKILKKRPNAKIVFLLNAPISPLKMLVCWRHVPAEVAALNEILMGISQKWSSVTTIQLSKYVTQPEAYISRSPFLLRWDVVHQIAEELSRFYLEATA